MHEHCIFSFEMITDKTFLKLTPLNIEPCGTEMNRKKDESKLLKVISFDKLLMGLTKESKLQRFKVIHIIKVTKRRL